MSAGVDTKLMPITVFWHLNKITKNKTIKLISIDWTLKCKFIYWKFFVPSCLSSSWISSNKLRTLSISKSAAENPSIYKRKRKQIIENKLNNVMIYYLSLKKIIKNYQEDFFYKKNWLYDDSRYWHSSKRQDFKCKSSDKTSLR